MDKQIVDIDGRKVVRVNDLRLDELGDQLHLVAVDVGAAGLLRRLGIEGPWRLLAVYFSAILWVMATAPRGR